LVSDKVLVSMVLAKGNSYHKVGLKIPPNPFLSKRGGGIWSLKIVELYVIDLRMGLEDVDWFPNYFLCRPH
jgi:hypothetical protein